MTSNITRVHGAGFALAAVAASFLHTPVGRAQSSEALQACARIEDEAVRLACFDAAVPADTNRERDGEDAVGAADPPRSPAGPVTPSPVPDAPRVPAEPPAREPPGRSDGPDARAGRPTGAAEDAFGLDERPEVPERISVVVVNVRTTTTGTALFETEHRQVWLQTSTRTRPYPDPPFGASIARGAVRSFFLRPDEGGLAIRVRRLQ